MIPNRTSRTSPPHLLPLTTPLIHTLPPTPHLMSRASPTFHTSLTPHPTYHTSPTPHPTSHTPRSTLRLLHTLLPGIPLLPSHILARTPPPVHTSLHAHRKVYTMPPLFPQLRVDHPPPPPMHPSPMTPFLNTLTPTPPTLECLHRWQAIAELRDRVPATLITLPTYIAEVLSSSYQ